jgi:hypothetical protein
MRLSRGSVANDPIRTCRPQKARYNVAASVGKSSPPPVVMQQIAHWLEKLGMSEYVECFAKSDIDISVLRDLTDQDLKLARASTEDVACDRRSFS